MIKHTSSSVLSYQLTIKGMKEEYLAQGFNDYLSKTINKNELNNIIKEYLDK